MYYVTLFVLSRPSYSRLLPALISPPPTSHLLTTYPSTHHLACESTSESVDALVVTSKHIIATAEQAGETSRRYNTYLVRYQDRYVPPPPPLPPLPLPPDLPNPNLALYCCESTLLHPPD